MHRILATTFAALCVGLSTAGCSNSKGSSGAPAQATAGVSSGTTPALVTSGSSAAPTPTPLPIGPITPALKRDVAQAFAPQLRYTAYHNDGNTSRQNRSEDFFPMGMASFFRELVANSARVNVQGSSGASPGASEVRPFTDQPLFAFAYLGGYPRYMAGDEPGTAPAYTHIYEDVTGRSIAPDGSGELVLYVEYWFFYPYDRSEAVIFGFIPTPGNVDISGHRSDWEHTTYRVRVRLAPGGSLQGGTVEEGFYFGHGRAFRTSASLELVDDAGRPDPAGTHPVVYVAQGKHASYPQAGEWKSASAPSWLADHTDFFRGNGVVIESWRVPLVDLEDPVAFAAELDPPELQTLVNRSSIAPLGLPDWTEYPGKWGPDLTLLSLGGTTLRIGTSSTGPKQKSYYGNIPKLLSYPLWDDVKQSNSRLRVYTDLGITLPQVGAAAAPVRR